MGALEWLKPCPLCGGEAVYATTWYVGGPWCSVGLDAIGTTIICEKCGCTIPSKKDADDADEAWNMRAERTCHNTKTRDFHFTCSGCGYEYSSWGGFGCDFGDEPDFAYCPNCGAKVVE